MRKRKTIKIDDREFTVKELAVNEILGIWDELGGGEDLTDLKGQIEQHMPKVTDATLEDLKAMAPSEIMMLVDAFREVNSDFFVMARSLGLGHMAKEIKGAIAKDFLALFWSLSKPGIPESGSTDSPPSLRPLKSMNE